MATTAAGVVTTTADLTAAIIERYMVATVLKRANKDTIFFKLGRVVKIPPGESRTISFQRFERLNPPLRQLTEAVTPAGIAMTATKVTAICEHWGSFTPLSDEAELTVRNQPFQQALELLGLQAAETVDREIQRVLLGGTQVFFPNGKTTRASLTTADVVDTPLLRKVRATLKNNGAPFYNGRSLVGVCDPFNAMDIQADPTFVEAAKFQNLVVLTEAELGTWMGIRWQESNNIPSIARDTNLSTAYAGGGFEAVAQGAEVALPNGAYFIGYAGYDSQGFESHLQSVTYATVTTSGGNQVAQVTLPSLPTGVIAYALYIGTVGGAVGTMALVADGLGAGVVKITGGTPVAATSYQAVTGGRAIPTQPAAGVNCHQMYVFGSDYFAVASLEDIKVMTTPKGAQKGDELDQRRAAGWKTFFKAVITNQLFGCRIESESNFD